ncbi:hypothetical protein AHAS_Ahas13G0228600 [Arachis hypogaea]
MCAAIAEVMPTVTHRLCGWHLEKKYVQRVKDTEFCKQKPNRLFSPGSPSLRSRHSTTKKEGNRRCKSYGGLQNKRRVPVSMQEERANTKRLVTLRSEHIKNYFPSFVLHQGSKKKSTKSQAQIKQRWRNHSQIRTVENPWSKSKLQTKAKLYGLD